MVIENKFSIVGEDSQRRSRDSNSIPVGEQAEPVREELPFGLSVTRPVTGVSVVWVAGELDMITCPLLDRYLETQLAARPAHLVVDLEAVEFMGCTGLSTLLTARELAQATGSVLHLTGMKRRAVMRPLELTGLLSLFHSYPTLTDAPSELTSGNPVNRATRASLSSITPAPG